MTDLFNNQHIKGDDWKHTEDSIVKLLRQRFNQGYNYRINNAFIYGHDWECDFFCTNQEGYAFEFEIKISRSDFQSDTKKYKHLLFKKPDKAGLLLPNRFYYVVPDGLVSPEEIPSYAGLIYVRNHIEIIKRAPFIHKAKQDYRRRLCDKFYARYIEQRREFVGNKYEMERYRQVIDNIKTLLSDEAKEALIRSGLLKAEKKDSLLQLQEYQRQKRNGENKPSVSPIV